MKNLNIMIKPASSLCNLRCKYCFYADVAQLRQIRSFGIMTDGVMERLLQNIRQDLVSGDRITFVFQGGEPTVAGLTWFQKFTAIVDAWDGIQVSYALQTNATLLDEAWCAFLKKRNFLVGVSWDILPECHNEVRVDAAGSGTHQQVLESLALLNQWHIDYNVLCTLTNFVARHPNQVWKQILKYNIRYVQFTPCLDELEKPGNSKYALEPKRFAAFYDRIFQLWYGDFVKGYYRSVKLFDDIVYLIAYRIPSACGMDGNCAPQMVVEGDGSVYPCDFYCTDAYKLGNLADTGLREIFQSDTMRTFLNRSHGRPKLCGSCRYALFCGGSCKRMQRQICCTGEDTFCGYQDFLNRHIAELQNIARRQLHR